MSGFQYSAPEGNAVGGGELSGGEAGGALGMAAKLVPSADRVKDFVLGVFSKTQPWGDFLNTKQFSMPQPTEIADRMKENVQNYAFNYLVVFLVLSVFVVLTNPLSLVSVVVVALGYYRLFVMAPGEPLHLWKLELDTNIKKGIVLGASGLFLFWLTGAITGIMSIVGTVGLLGGVHALLRKPASEPDFESGYTG